MRMQQLEVKCICGTSEVSARVEDGDARGGTFITLATIQITFSPSP